MSGSPARVRPWPKAIRAAGSLEDTAGQAAVADVPTAATDCSRGRRASSARRPGVRERDRDRAARGCALRRRRPDRAAARRGRPHSPRRPRGRARARVTGGRPRGGRPCAARSGGRSVAVVDAEGRFLGLVPPTRLLQILELEHEEDLARLGGFLAGLGSRGPRRRKRSPGGCGTDCPGSVSAFSGRWRPPSSSERSRTRSGSRFCLRSSCRRSSTWPTPWVRRPRPSSFAGWRWACPCGGSSRASC